VRAESRVHDTPWAGSRRPVSADFSKVGLLTLKPVLTKTLSVRLNNDLTATCPNRPSEFLQSSHTTVAGFSGYASDKRTLGYSCSRPQPAGRNLTDADTQRAAQL
jgi:hypothetical protein